MRESLLKDLADQDLEPDARDSALIEQAAAVADQVAILEAAMARSGVTTTDKDGQVRPSPLSAELRQQRHLLARLLSGVVLELPAGKDAKAARAGRASWAARAGRSSPATRGAVGMDGGMSW